jgi:hypothetical protein
MVFDKLQYVRYMFLFTPQKERTLIDQIETSPPPARHADGRFGPGNPGRRPGSRNRASHRALTAILDDFHDNKDVVLPRLRQYFTTDYIKVIVRLLDLQPAASDPEPESDAAACDHRNNGDLR